jgi:hypothetical protein
MRTFRGGSVIGTKLAECWRKKRRKTLERSGYPQGREAAIEE